MAHGGFYRPTKPQHQLTIRHTWSPQTAAVGEISTQRSSRLACAAATTTTTTITFKRPPILKIGCPSSEYNPFWHIGHVAPFGGCLTAPQHRLKPGHTFDRVSCLRSPLSASSLKLVCIQFGFVLCSSFGGVPFPSFSLHGREQGQTVSIGSFFSVNQ